ncbi:hypothetical protein HGA88_00285 [Candidatus Roizmanbacteria bacterium]|nr:hypothetical protein [Candidatus Roizmanbacteria bacterium]
MGIKERRTKILLSLFLIADVDFSSLEITPEIQHVFDYSLNQKTASTFASLSKEGSIMKTDSQYQLTEKGFDQLCLEFPFFRFLKHTWDGKWRVLSYEIPESKRELRDKLRREVTGWGLGPWHRSFWLTPHPIIESLKQLVSQKEEEQYIQAFESEHVFGDKDILIEKVWGTKELDKKYRELFKVWHDILSQDLEKKDKLKKIVGEYVELLRLDPGLPKDLVGEKWIGFEAFSIFKEIKTILLAQ